jgi:hypothetical protein
LFLLSPFRLIDRLLDHVVVVLGSVVFWQIPAFVAHYTERLRGQVDEAVRNVRGWQAIADRLAGGDLQALVRTYAASSSPEAAEAGAKCAQDVCRMETLRGALEAITAAEAWARPLVFARHADPGIARAAAASFVPTLRFDLESLAYAGAGLLVAWVVYLAVRRLSCSAVRRGWRKFRSRAG